MTSLERTLCFTQGTYFLASGMWPLISISSFQAVTGPKTDVWLVKTVGLLVTVIALTLLSAALRRRTTAETRVLGGGAAAVLAGVDIIYSVSGVISEIYLADAAVELAIVAAWTLAWTRASKG